MNTHPPIPDPAQPSATAFPPWWEGLLLDALGLRRDDTVAPKFLEALHFFNTQWVGGEGVDYSDPRADLRAYACFYMPANMPKLWLMLDQAPEFIPALAGQPWRIREIGCGPGTFLWSALLWLEQHAPEALQTLTGITGVDRHPAFLALARRIAAAIATRPAFRHLKIEFVEADWHDVPPTENELVIFGNVLNEAAADEPVRGAALNAAAVAVIEPGTVKSFHRLLPLRDALAAAGWRVSFPCPGEGQSQCRSLPPCPMPADNWCHFAVNRFALPLVQRMAAKAGRLNPRHNFCGFLFRRDEHPPAAAPLWRVLSHLRKSNRSGVRWLCNGACLREVVLGRHARNEGTRPFLEAAWGDLLEIRPGADHNNPATTRRLTATDQATPVRGRHPPDRRLV